MKKNYLVLLSYAFMTFYSFRYASPSAFMFLVGLLMELILLLIIYLIVSFKTTSFDLKSNAVYISIFAIPILLFHYFIAWSLTDQGDMLKENFDKYGLFFPLTGHYPPIIFMAIGLVIGYYKDFKSLVKNENSMGIVEYSVISNMFRVWAVGLVGISFYLMKTRKNDEIDIGQVVICMLIARIIAEFIAKDNEKLYSPEDKV